jgi:hypothetical protein
LVIYGKGGGERNGNVKQKVTRFFLGLVAEFKKGSTLYGKS